jgi:hypothetical protein
MNEDLAAQTERGGGKLDEIKQSDPPMNTKLITLRL